jgi:fructoselysine-6-P-deglycase FrlB-like protein
MPVDYMISPDVVSLEPAALGADTIAIGASYSGKTMDTLAARDTLRKRGVLLLAVTRKPDAVLAEQATWSISYESVALYSSPAYLSLLLTVELGKACGQWTEELESFEQALEALPSLLRCIADESRQLAERGAAQLDGNKLLVMSGGCTYSLGYMMAFDMFGEYLKQYCAFLHYGEFRHGPLEIVRSGEPSMMFLMGNDSSRPFGEATLQFAQRNGAPTLVFDAAQLAPKAHPLLGALVLYQSQLWLLYYLACGRGIDLDAYKYMHITPYAAGDTFY